MRAYCSTQLCRRKVLMEFFGFDQDPVSPGHLCCDNCRKNCVCLVCNEMAKGKVAETAKEKPEITPEKKAKQLAQSMLQEYFSAENSICECPLASAVTGLCPEVAAHIATKYTEYKSYEALCCKYSHLKKNFLENIHKILVHIYDKYHSDKL